MKSIIGRMQSRRLYHHPLFLVGASRSGTISLYKALGTHPEIFSMPSEDPFVTSVAAAVAPFEFGDETDYYRDSIKLPEQYLYDQLRRLCFESAAGKHYGAKAFTKYELKNGIALSRKRLWCVKTFPLEKHARALLKLYPEARFVYIVRNGIDVVQSRTKFPAFRDQEFSYHCQFWTDAASKFSYLYELDESVDIRQEQLLSQPDQVFERIADHLGVARDNSPAKYVRTTLVHSLGDKKTHANVDVRKSLLERKPAFETWSKNQRDTFKRICGDAMGKLGYEIPF